MSTVHLEPSSKWLPVIEAAEKELSEKGIKWANEIHTHWAQCAVKNPHLEHLQALRRLIAPARRNLPLDVDAEIAALFIK